MAISTRTRRLLWGQAGNVCAFPGCDQRLIEPGAGAAGGTVIGIEAHIVGQSADGPRGYSPLTPTERDEYSNLILLCPTHHQVVDKGEAEYSVQVLTEMKARHVVAVHEGRTFDERAAQIADEQWADIVDGWAERCDLDGWNDWTSWLLREGQPRMSKDVRVRLQDLRDWTFGRVWPAGHDRLRSAFGKFVAVLNDLLREFDRHREERDDWWITRKFYRDGDYETGSAQRLEDAYDVHVDLVEDLTLELTRAANYVCDQVRLELEPAFRLDAGVLAATYGPTGLLEFTTVRTEYRGAERSERPYPGLDAFQTAVLGRDHSFARAREEGLE